MRNRPSLEPCSGSKKKFLLFVLTASVLVGGVFGADFRIDAFDRSGHLSWTNPLVPGVCTIEFAPAPTGPWTPVQNFFTTNSGAQVSLSLPSSNAFFRRVCQEARLQREQLVTAIEDYKSRLGFYPPDHALSGNPFVIDVATNQLLYDNHRWRPEELHLMLGQRSREPGDVKTTAPSSSGLTGAVPQLPSHSRTA